MRALAIVCVRNEELHVESTLRDLIAERIDVVLIDHDSTDLTVRLARPFLGRGLLAIERLPWEGRFTLSAQLEAKRRIVDASDHDWVVHADADEWLRAPAPYATLHEGLSAADAAGFDSVRFAEFVFVPRPGTDLRGTDYRKLSRRYYHFRPHLPYLLRAWKRSAAFDNRKHAGHFLTGATRPKPFPQNFVLRHYIALSEEHARRKYAARAFDEREVALGWHYDRVVARTRALRFPGDDPRIGVLPHWSSRELDVSVPSATHFWEW